jgi:hypothetical protein
MPPMDRPPVSPQAQAQMGPPGGAPGLTGFQQASQGMDKSPAEVAVSTVEKILMGVPGDKFKDYAAKAIATLKLGLAMEQQAGPQSSPMGGMPIKGAGGPPPPNPMPPVPGQMPG